MTLQTTFLNASFLDANLFSLLQEQDFSADGWQVLSLLRIPTVKDLITRLHETKRETDIVATHSGEVFAEMKSFLTTRGFPLSADEMTAHDDHDARAIGVVDSSKGMFHLLSNHTFDFDVSMTSRTCDTAPEELWHTRLVVQNATLGNTYELLMRKGDRASFATETLLPLQVEHLGFEDEQAHMRFRSNTMHIHIG